MKGLAPMTTKGIPQHRPPIGRVMRVPGTDPLLTRVEVGEGAGWRVIVGPEAWILTEVSRRIWQGFTEDHLTGTPRLRHLSAVLRWILDHQEEWEAKLRVRREQGTRMVDPKPTQKETSE
jgi:hypothetical protein